MKAFKELENQNLNWVQPSVWKRTYELHNEDEEVLAVLRMHAWREQGELEAPGNRWQFLHKGFWRSRIEVVSTVTGDTYAIYHHHGKRLELRNGDTFHWKQINFWGSKWAWLDASDRPVVGFQTGGSLRFNSEVRLDPDTAGQPTMPVLVFLGWYLLIKQRDAASTTAVIAASAG